MDDLTPYTNLEELHFIEDIGLFFERTGMPRMAGRILGVLLIADPPAQSITDITLRLSASKSSISIMSRLLIEVGLIERVASPMPRRDYYRFKPGGWELYMRQWLNLMGSLHRVAERGLHLTREKSADQRERLLEAHDLFSYMEANFPAFLESFRQSRTTRNHTDSGS